MTKKHFIRIAAILRNAKISAAEKQKLTAEFASMFMEMNPHFDAQRFADAVFK